MSNQMRTDEVLYTGMSSVAARKVALERKKRTQEKQVKKNEFQKDASVVFEELDLMISRIPNRTRELISPNDTETNTKSKLLALWLLENDLRALRAKLSNILKVKDE